VKERQAPCRHQTEVEFRDWRSLMCRWALRNLSKRAHRLATLLHSSRRSAFDHSLSLNPHQVQKVITNGHIGCIGLLHLVAPLRSVDTM